MTTNESQALVRTSSTDELALRPTYPVEVLVERQERITEVMRKLMREGEHYGRIPGCGDKPTLLKPGAEKLNAAFGLAPTFAIERRDLPNGHREYEIVCTLVSIGTGVAVGQGVGSCSTMESRYRWRKGERTCPDCGQPAIIRGRADYGGGWLCFAKKGGCGSKWPDGAAAIEAQPAGRVENPDIADTYNTVLKIAKKRAQVDATLTAVGASDLLTQDLEDMGAGDRDLNDHRDARDVPAQREAREQRPPPKRAQQAAPAEPAVEVDDAYAMDLLGRIDDAATAEELKALAPKLNALPKGSSARRACRVAYDERMSRLTASAVGRGSAEDA